MHTDLHIEHLVSPTYRSLDSKSCHRSSNKPESSNSHPTNPLSVWRTAAAYCKVFLSVFHFCSKVCFKWSAGSQDRHTSTVPHKTQKSIMSAPSAPPYYQLIIILCIDFSVYSLSGTLLVQCICWWVPQPVRGDFYGIFSFHRVKTLFGLNVQVHRSGSDPTRLCALSRNCWPQHRVSR